MLEVQLMDPQSAFCSVNVLKCELRTLRIRRSNLRFFSASCCTGLFLLFSGVNYFERFLTTVQLPEEISSFRCCLRNERGVKIGALWFIAEILCKPSAENHKIKLLETMFTKLCNYDTLTWYGPHYICFHWNVLQSCLVRATSQYSVWEGGKMSLTLPNKCFSCIKVLLAHLAKVTNYQSETNQTYRRWLLNVSSPKIVLKVLVTLYRQ